MYCVATRAVDVVWLAASLFEPKHSCCEFFPAPSNNCPSGIPAAWQTAAMLCLQVAATHTLYLSPLGYAQVPSPCGLLSHQLPVYLDPSGRVPLPMPHIFPSFQSPVKKHSPAKPHLQLPAKTLKSPHYYWAAMKIIGLHSFRVGKQHA